jgi:hypothetical protein
MAQQIPVPAEVVRQIATEASDSVTDLREKGYYASAERREQQVAKAFDALDGRDGEFVSISSRVVSSLTAEATNEVPDYAEAARVFLEQYGIWG